MSAQPAPEQKATVVRSEWRTPDCAEPKSNDEADLCEQRRMAKAAEQTVWINTFQTSIGILGAALLVWTLWYTRKTAEAGIVAADAATKAADVAERSLVQTQRAFVLFSNFHVRTHFAEGKKVKGWDIILCWDNKGPTPGIGAFGAAHIKTFAIGEPIESDFDISPSDRIRGGTVPHGGFESLPIPITIELAQAIMRNEQQTYIWGLVDYRDIFPNTGVHRTRVCAQLLVDPNREGSANPFTFRMHEKENYAD